MGMEHTGFYRAVVVRNADPEGKSRVQLKIPQVLGPVTTGWVLPMMLLDSTLPAIGEQVWATFEGGDESYPLYLRQGMISEGKRGAAPVLSASPSVYRDRDGVELGQVRLAWSQISKAIDGTEVTPETYRVEARMVSNATGVEYTDTGWVSYADTEQLFARFAPFDIGSTWQFRVGPRVNHVNGTWSASVTVRFTMNNAKINPPSLPTVTASGSSVLVEWDGLDESGSPIPAGAKVQVSMSPDETPGDVYELDTPYYRSVSILVNDITSSTKNRDRYVFLRTVSPPVTQLDGDVPPDGYSSPWTQPVWVWATVAGEDPSAGVRVGEAGTIQMTAASDPPAGWLLCQGASVLRSQYARLFAAIGTAFGAADADHFNLPNFQGKVAAGYSSTDTTFGTVGTAGGEKEHQLVISEIPNHSGHLAPSGGQPYYVDRDLFLASGIMSAYGTPGRGWDVQNGNEVIPASGAKGGGNTHNNLQPFLTVRFIIKI